MNLMRVCERAGDWAYWNQYNIVKFKNKIKLKKKKKKEIIPLIHTLGI